MDKEIIVELKNISKIYFYPQEELKILENVNLQVFKGDKIAILGPSGVGKTTLLNIIGTLDKPSSGEIYYFGKKLDWNDEENLLKLRRGKIGFIFQLHYLIPEFNVIENLILPGLISGWDLKTCLNRAEEILKILNLSKRAKHRPYALSGGERQKVAIGRAIFLNPVLLLADEPTGNLDPKSAEEVIEIFLKINQNFDTAIVMVTHNWELAKKMEEIYLLKNGFLVKLQNI